MNRESRHDAAQIWVPIYVAGMSGAFSSYLLLKGLKKIIHVETITAIIAGAMFACVTYLVVRKLLIKYD